LLRRPRGRQDDRDHADRHPGLPGRADAGSPHGDLRPPASLPPRPPRGGARLALVMLVPIEQLIDGVVRTLLESVLPDVEARFAPGQLYAAVDVLRNLRDRVEARVALEEPEASSAATAIERALASLPPEAAAAVATARDAAPTGPPAERAAALRAALVVALE